MNVRVTVIAALVLAALALGACAAPAARTNATDPQTQTPAAQTEPTQAAPEAEETAETMETTSDLASTSWLLSELDGAAPVAGGRPATLEIDAEGRVAGSTGCNRFMGGYSADGATVTFGQLATTMMACPDELMQQERTFLDVMGAAASYSIVDDTLTITAADGRTVVFTRA